MSDKVNVEVIPEKAIMKIEISGGFYVRVDQLLHYIAGTEGDPQVAAQKIIEFKNSKGEPSNASEYHMLTLLALIASIEEAAKEQGQVESHEVTLPVELPATAPES